MGWLIKALRNHPLRKVEVVVVVVEEEEEEEEEESLFKADAVN